MSTQSVWHFEKLTRWEFKLWISTVSRCFNWVIMKTCHIMDFQGLMIMFRETMLYCDTLTCSVVTGYYDWFNLNGWHPHRFNKGSRSYWVIEIPSSVGNFVIRTFKTCLNLHYDSKFMRADSLSVLRPWTRSCRSNYNFITEVFVTEFNQNDEQCWTVENHVQWMDLKRSMFPAVTGNYDWF